MAEVHPLSGLSHLFFAFVHVCRHSRVSSDKHSVMLLLLQAQVRLASWGNLISSTQTGGDPQELPVTYREAARQT